MNTQKLLPFKPDTFRGRGYHAYELDSDGQRNLVGVHPGCSKCNGYGSVLGYTYNEGVLDYVDCPNCDGLGFGTWIVPLTPESDVFNYQVQQVLNFTTVASPLPRAKYFNVGSFEIYIRNTHLYLGEPERQPVRVLVIANITNKNVVSRGTGGLHKLLDILEQTRIVSFECVHNRRLRIMLRMRGYRPVPLLPRSFVKIHAS